MARHSHNLIIKCDPNTGARTVHYSNQSHSERRRICARRPSKKIGRPPPVSSESIAAFGLRSQDNGGGLPQIVDGHEEFHVELLLSDDQARIVLGKGQRTIRRIKVSVPLGVKTGAPTGDVRPTNESGANVWIDWCSCTERAEPDRATFFVRARALHKVEKAMQLVREKLARQGKPLPDKDASWINQYHLTINGEMAQSGDSNLLSDSSPKAERKSQSYKNEEKKKIGQDVRSEPKPCDEAKALINTLSEHIEEFKKGITSLRAEISELKLERANGRLSASQSTKDVWAKISEELTLLRADVKELKESASKGSDVVMRVEL